MLPDFDTTEYGKDKASNMPMPDPRATWQRSTGAKHREITKQQFLIT
jgi:hypothetical protein